MHRFRVGLRLLEVLRDARLSFRALMARPLFTLTTVMTFALGIGATAVVFSLVHSVLLSPLPYREPDRLDLRPAGDSGDRRPRADPRRQPAVVHILGRACRATCEQMAALVASTIDAHRAGRARRTHRREDLAGALRRARHPADAGAVLHSGRGCARPERVVIITHGFWQRRFAGDPAVIGRVITLDSVPVEIVGVLPATFRLPQLPQLSVPNRVDNPFELFRPLAWSEALRQSWGEYDNVVIVRRPAGVSVQATEAELTAITKAEYERAQIHPYAVARPLMAAVTADARRPLWLVLGAVAAALLIACVNVAGLLGARWTARQRELAIRTAMGAGRGAPGAVGGDRERPARNGRRRTRAALASMSLRAVLATAPAAVPRLDEVRLDTTSLIVTAAITLACALICTVVPAWRAARVDPGDTLKAVSALDDARAAVDRHPGLAGRWRSRTDRDAARRGRVARRQLRQRPAGRPRFTTPRWSPPTSSCRRRGILMRPRARASSMPCSMALDASPASGSPVSPACFRSRARPPSTPSSLSATTRGGHAGGRQPRAGERRLLRGGRSTAAARTSPDARRSRAPGRGHQRPHREDAVARARPARPELQARPRRRLPGRRRRGRRQDPGLRARTRPGRLRALRAEHTKRARARRQGKRRRRRRDRKCASRGQEPRSGPAVATGANPRQRRGRCPGDAAIPGAAAGGVRRGWTAARLPRDLRRPVGDGRKPARGTGDQARARRAPVTSPPTRGPAGVDAGSDSASRSAWPPAWVPRGSLPRCCSA